MCGLVGVFSTFKSGLFPSQIDTFEQLLVVGMVRGYHGTGVMKIDDKGRCQVRKLAGHTLNLMSSPKYADFHIPDKNENVVALMGHNRHATKGQLINRHTHPFREGHIVLAHNGTLTDWRDLPTPEKGKPFEVDSNALAYSISKVGLQETLDRCSGAMALTWHDANENSINLYRNPQRPLFIASHTNNQDFVYASEVRMLHWIMDRTNQNVTNWKFKELGDFEHMKIERDTGVITYKKVEKSYAFYPTYKQKNHTLTQKELNEAFDEYDDDSLPFDTIGRSPDFKGNKKNNKKLSKNVTAALVLVAKKQQDQIEKPKLRTAGFANGRYSETKNLGGYQKEDEIIFKMTNYDSLNHNADDGFCIVGTRPDMPDVQIRAIISKLKDLDRLVSSDLLAGVIINLLYDEDCPSAGKNKENIIWLRMVHPVGVLSEGSDTKGKMCYAKDVPSFKEIAASIH